MLILLVVSVGFLAYANGANDNFKGVASLYGSGLASYRQALLWATLTTLAGSLCALYLAQTLLIKFSGKGLIVESLIHSVPFITAVAAGASTTLLFATRYGFPVSTTHALLGAMAGGGLSNNWNELNYSALQHNFMLPLLFSPLVALLLAITVYWILKQIKQRLLINKPICLCVENEADIGSDSGVVALASHSSAFLSIENEEDCANQNFSKVLGISVQGMTDKLHFLSAGSVCFARGLNDTPKIAALLLLMPSIEIYWIIILVATFIALGGLLNAKRVAETMSFKITEISHGQGMSANMATAFLVVFASHLGMPVSTTHVSVGSLFGIGLAGGKANFRMIRSILLSWLLILPCAAISAAIIFNMIGTL